MSFFATARVRAACFAQVSRQNTRLPQNLRHFYFSTRRSDQYANSHDENDKSPRYSRTYKVGTAPLLLCTSFASGIFGYYLAGQPNLTALAADSEEAFHSPTFGSADDFKKGISELKRSLTRPGAVSTDSNDLQAHGFLNANDADYSGNL